ncbi:MAG: hypothetical protein AB1755_03415 [Candidatus Omnitrophota bacterium]
MIVKIYIFIFLSAIVSAFAQVCFKNVADRFENVGIHNQFQFYKQILLRKTTWLGFLFVFLDIFTWTVVLNFTELSFAFPFCSLNYIIVLGTSKFVLKEKVSLKRLLGTLLIMAGIILVGLTHNSH